ncbi:MAG: ThiF family adenylyltransferase [Candidatus Hermodarchaeota archaeon]
MERSKISATRLRPKQIKVLFLGCGFLASHIVPAILPYCSQITLVDHDRVEQENYENSIYLKGQTRKFKVRALANTIQILSSIPVNPVHKFIEKLADIPPDSDFAFITFDNIKARKITATLDIPAIGIGVTENYAIIEWADQYPLPTTKEEIDKVEREMLAIRDVCSRLEFRSLGSLAAAYASHVFRIWLETSKKQSYQISIQNGLINAHGVERE